MPRWLTLLSDSWFQRSWSQGPGIKPHIRLYLRFIFIPSLFLSSSVPLPSLCALSLSKIKIKSGFLDPSIRQQGQAGHSVPKRCSKYIWWMKIDAPPPIKSTPKFTYKQLVLFTIYGENRKERVCIFPISQIHRGLVRHDEALGPTGSSNLHYWSKI